MSERREPLGIVCDCVIFVQAIANDESHAAKILELMDAGTIRVYVSEEILRELREVASRPRLRAKLSALTTERVEAFLQRLEQQAFWSKQVADVFAFRRDQKDAPYINLAVATAADFIVSRDHDLLDLMTQYDDDSKEFRQRFRPLRVITPEELLSLIASNST